MNKKSINYQKAISLTKYKERVCSF